MQRRLFVSLTPSLPSPSRRAREPSLYSLKTHTHASASPFGRLYLGRQASKQASKQRSPSCSPFISRLVASVALVSKRSVFI